LKARDHVGRVIRLIVEFFEDQWFDLSRNVRTSGNVSLQTAGIAVEELGDSELYQPARPAHIRQALREIPVRDVSGFSYVDLGSGKGRTLFVAAEFPFERITGVEFSRSLHDQACANIRRFRFWKRRCRDIQCFHGNAKNFLFPDGKIVLYMFNPFGSATMRQVLSNLEDSLRLHPRHVIAVLLWPRCEDQVARVEGMHRTRKTRQYQIFEAYCQQELEATIRSEEAIRGR
jgi:SAM-dependent methyltransferase